MKKSIYFLLAAAICFLFTTHSYAGNIAIYGCYKKNHGQFRVVDSWNECLKSEVPISWVAQSNDIVDYIVIYVNASTGVDEVGYGLSEDKPFKTIGFALNRVPLLRSHSEIRTLIDVAAGTYNESINISINKIWLKGKGVDQTIISGNGSNNVITITGPVGGRISDFSISGGGSGIVCFGSSYTVENCEITNNNGYAGLEIRNSSDVFLNNTAVFSNLQNGIAVYRNSTLISENSIVKENNSNGLEVWYTSTARVSNSEFDNNGNSGIQVGGGSSVRLFQSKLLNNYNCGIDSTSNSTALLRGGNLIKGNNTGMVDWRGGVGVYQGSEFTITNDSNVEQDKIIENHQNGIFLSNNSTSLIKDANISNNFGDGIDLNFGCSGAFEELVTITGNAAHGIICSDAVLRNNANVYGNGTDVLCP